MQRGHHHQADDGRHCQREAGELGVAGQRIGELG